MVSTIGVALSRIARSGALSAHHAFSAEFDASKPIILRGTVTKTEWINPHSWIHLDVKDDDGKVATWAIECGAPNSLLRRGLNKTSIPVGHARSSSTASGEGRIDDGQRQGHHVAGRQEVVHRLVGDRRAVRGEKVTRHPRFSTQLRCRQA